MAVLSLLQATPAAAPGGPFPRMLEPAYRAWRMRPAEMLGFWLWAGPETARDQARRTGANATSLHLPLAVREDKTYAGMSPALPPAALGAQIEAGGMDVGVGVGEHNNAFFVSYPGWFWRQHPDAAMRDRAGNVIRAGDRPWPALDAPSLVAASTAEIREVPRLLMRRDSDTGRHSPGPAEPAPARRDAAGAGRVRYWVIGGEEGYPDYFGLPAGDYRPEALRRYREWLELHEVPAGSPPEGPLWTRYRESVAADRLAVYTQAFHVADGAHPAFAPTHGNPFALDLRAKLAYPIAGMAGAADGFEAGPIAIDDDAERIVRMTLDLQTSFGVPVVAPRLANKRLDPEATGGGRSFSPASLRRFVMESVGLGVWHIGLAQWQGTLPDGEWGIAGTPAEREAARLFARPKAAGPWLEGCERLRPQVTLYLSDAAWRTRWQDRWNVLYEAACSRGWCAMPVVDAQVGAALARETPVLVSVDNAILPPEARRGLAEYAAAGGTVVTIGQLGAMDEYGKAAPAPKLPRAVSVPDDAAGPNVRVLHQTETTKGANTWTADVKPLPTASLERLLASLADLWPVRAFEADSRRPAEGVETLLLTDGSSLVISVISRAKDPRTVELEPSRGALGRLGRGWWARDLLGDDAALPVRGSRCRLRLEPEGAALVLLAPRVTKEQAEQAVAAASAAFRRVEPHGALLGQSRPGADMQAHLAAGRFAKAWALARQASHALAVRATAGWSRARDWHVQAEVWTPDGKRVRGAEVVARFVPGPFAWRKLPEVRPGAYRLEAPYTAAPVGWVPGQGYVHGLNGQTRVVVRASVRGLEGGATASLGPGR